MKLWFARDREFKKLLDRALQPEVRPAALSVTEAVTNPEKPLFTGLDRHFLEEVGIKE